MLGPPKKTFSTEGLNHYDPAKHTQNFVFIKINDSKSTSIKSNGGTGKFEACIELPHSFPSPRTRTPTAAATDLNS